MHTVKIKSRGRITIPKRLREALDLQEGDELFIEISDKEGKTITLAKKQQDLRSLLKRERQR